MVYIYPSKRVRGRVRGEGGGGAGKAKPQGNSRIAKIKEDAAICKGTAQGGLRISAAESAR